MKEIVVLLLFAVYGLNVCYAQANKETLGTVVVLIPSFKYDFVNKESNTSIPEVLLRGKQSTRTIPYIGREIITKRDGTEDYHVDKYTINVPKGFYRIVINNLEHYRLANLLVEPQKTYKYDIPQYRFAYDEVCKGDERILKTFNSDEPISAQEKKYSRKPYKKISRDVFSLLQPFEAVVTYCGKEINNGLIEYKSAQLYYKNYYIDAESIILDKHNRKLKAEGTDELPAFLQIDGEEVKTNEIINLDLADVVFPLKDIAPARRISAMYHNVRSWLDDLNER